MLSEGPTILLIPGLMLDGDLWADIRPDLVRLAPTRDVDTTQDSSIEAMAARAIASLKMEFRTHG